MSTKVEYTQRLFRFSIGLSVFLSIGLILAFFTYRSQIALAQGADSVLDVVAAAGLLWALRISLRPPDDSHPFGHEGAQPIAALIVAVITGVLAIEVIREAIAALVRGTVPNLSWGLIAIVVAKALLKGLLAVLSARQATPGSALRAFHIDARNDALLGVSSIAGLLAARFANIPDLDSWLALPVGVWIGISGVTLGAESVALLMGEAPASQRQRDLSDLALEVPGVRRVEDFKARWHGEAIRVWVEVRVDPNLSVREGHDIGEAVEKRLEQEEDVVAAVAHVDAA